MPDTMVPDNRHSDVSQPHQASGQGEESNQPTSIKVVDDAPNVDVDVEGLSNASGGTPTAPVGWSRALLCVSIGAAVGGLAIAFLLALHVAQFSLWMIALIPICAAIGFAIGALTKGSMSEKIIEEEGDENVHGDTIEGGLPLEDRDVSGVIAGIQDSKFVKNKEIKNISNTLKAANEKLSAIINRMENITSHESYEEDINAQLGEFFQQVRGLKGNDFLFADPIKSASKFFDGKSAESIGCFMQVLKGAQLSLKKLTDALHETLPIDAAQITEKFKDFREKCIDIFFHRGDDPGKEIVSNDLLNFFVIVGKSEGRQDMFPGLITRLGNFASLEMIKTLYEALANLCDSNAMEAAKDLIYLTIQCEIGKLKVSGVNSSDERNAILASISDQVELIIKIVTEYGKASVSVPPEAEEASTDTVATTFDKDQYFNFKGKSKDNKNEKDLIERFRLFLRAREMKDKISDVNISALIVSTLDNRFQPNYIDENSILREQQVHCAKEVLDRKNGYLEKASNDSVRDESKLAVIKDQVLELESAYKSAYEKAALGQKIQSLTSNCNKFEITLLQLDVLISKEMEKALRSE
ncbi:MAG: hypothetical protein LBI69_05010 [Puniceicoccales bacterium]|jgi:hypothetical protein|nr:hypothetical protein [Puniceicoccales bacterium]